MAKGPGEVRQVIDGQREALADTVQALAQKADVNSKRVLEKVSRNADQLQDRASDMVSKVRDVTPDQVQSGVKKTANSVQRRPSAFAAAAALLGGLLIGRQLGRGGRT
jgi:ElaB/YqjD/DUF883 family membrane-anchored ribosome-binding protein